MQILIVEDTPDTRELLVFQLTLEGFDVTTAEDGQDGLAAAMAGKPHLVLTDLSMPRMNGIELIRCLRKDSELKDTKIIALTAHRSGSARAAREAGADLVLYKPEAFTTLTDIIKSVLQI